MTKTTNSKIIVLYGICCLHKKGYLHWANGTKVFSEQGKKIKFPSSDCTKSWINYLEEWKDKRTKSQFPVTVTIKHKFCWAFVRIKQFHYHLKSFSALVTEIYFSFLKAQVDLEKGLS